MKQQLTTALLLAGLVSLATIQPVSGAGSLPCAEVVVRAGDSLSKIAEQHLADPLAYPLIVEATNARPDDYEVIDNPDLIEPGQKLCVPLPRTIDLADFLDLREKPVRVLFSEIRFQSVGQARTDIVWRTIAEYPDGITRECWLAWSSNRDIDGTRISSGCLDLPGQPGPVATPNFRRPQS